MKVTLPVFNCLRCNHAWSPRIASLPNVCPSCKSPYWSKPRTDKAGPIAKKKIISEYMASLGSKTSEAKKAAVRENGKLGGRPKKLTKCS